jgi:hypothetical protein
MVCRTFRKDFQHIIHPCIQKNDWQKIYVYMGKILNSYPSLELIILELYPRNRPLIFTIQKPANPYAERLAGTVKKQEKTSV